MQSERYGEALWLRDPDACCNLRKVEPNERALDGKTAWIAGMRRDQSKTRADIGIVEWDVKFNLVKLNPLASWDEKKVWSYIMANDVPYNELHDRGYPSIGCTNCTQPVNPGDDPRSGRWAGLDKEECGIQEGSISIIENEAKTEAS
jgi:phosphoadenosine phosphosulfate reductase